MAMRYWRLVGFTTRVNGPLELSETRIYEASVLADSGATLTATVDPDTGSVADLRDGLASGVVSWAYVKHSSPGFALVWDFGASGGVSAPSLRFGACTSADTFVLDVALQNSSDGINWTAYSTDVDIPYTGSGTVTTVAFIPPDAYAANVALLLHADGMDASTSVIESSSEARTLSVFHNARISTAQSKFGGTSLAFGGSLDYVQDTCASYAFGTGDFTIEAWIYANSMSGYSGLFSTFSANPSGVGVAIYGHVTSGLIHLDVGNGGTGDYMLCTDGISVGVWKHIAAVRIGNALTVYVNGRLAGSGTTTKSVDRTVAVIGRTYVDLADNVLNGYIDELRVTKGVGRYTSDFTPASSAFGSQKAVLARHRRGAPTPTRMLPPAALPDSTAQDHLREQPFFDAYYGGLGTVTGSVKQKNLPANIPLHRRVLLLDERSQQVIREVWSDATTGAYAFRGVRRDLTYTVLAYDYTQTFRAVLADNITPELLP